MDKPMPTIHYNYADEGKSMVSLNDHNRVVNYYDNKLNEAADNCLSLAKRYSDSVDEIVKLKDQILVLLADKE